jgi:hypothetical protein
MLNRIQSNRIKSRRSQVPPTPHSLEPSILGTRESNLLGLSDVNRLGGVERRVEEVNENNEVLDEDVAPKVRVLQHKPVSHYVS